VLDAVVTEVGVPALGPGSCIGGFALAASAERPLTPCASTQATLKYVVPAGSALRVALVPVLVAAGTLPMMPPLSAKACGVVAKT
jgi:sulfite exporter TauE/SafE